MLRKYHILFSTLKTLSPYRILNLQQTATQEQIKNRYYELAQKYHPDRDPSFAQKFKTINEAYHILKDPEKRRELDYDIENKGGHVASKMNYSSSRHSYGNAYQKEQSELEKEFLRRKAHYAGKMYYTGSNQKFDFGLQMNKEQGKGMKNARMKEQQQTIRVVLSVGLAVIALFGVVELVFKVYQFNTSGHKKDSQTLQQSRRN